MAALGKPPVNRIYPVIGCWFIFAAKTKSDETIQTADQTGDG